MKAAKPSKLLAALAKCAGGFVADWEDFVFLHYALPAAELAFHIPYPLDTLDGRAFISFVSFRLERMRPARACGLPAAISRILLRPISNHQFLNLRTYVRGPAGPGIHFIAEWIDNHLSARVGPGAYGLPYRCAEMQRTDLTSGGLRHIHVRDEETAQSASFVVPMRPDRAAGPVTAGSLDEFLLERYRAYTHQEGTGRWFLVKHPAWEAAPFTLARTNTALQEKLYPWFQHAMFIGGHLAAGFRDVGMGPPHTLTAAAGATAASSAREAACEALNPAR